MLIPVAIETLPQVTSLSGNDVLVLNKSNSFTATVTLDAIKEYILQALQLNVYYADNATLGLSSNNTFYVRTNGINFAQLSPDLQQQISSQNESGNEGSTLTGQISSFATPLTATGDFLIVNVNNQYKALRIWNYT